MKYDVLYYLMNEKISLVEIKLTGLPANAAKADKYQWLMLKTDTSAEQLVFSSMKEEEVAGKNINVRVFEGSELRFDSLFGKFVLGDELYILKNCSSETLPQSISDKISEITNH